MLFYVERMFVILDLGGLFLMCKKQNWCFKVVYFLLKMSFLWIVEKGSEISLM